MPGELKIPIQIRNVVLPKNHSNAIVIINSNADESGKEKWQGVTFAEIFFPLTHYESIKRVGYKQFDKEQEMVDYHNSLVEHYEKAFEDMEEGK